MVSQPPAISSLDKEDPREKRKRGKWKA